MEASNSQSDAFAGQIMTFMPSVDSADVASPNLSRPAGRPEDLFRDVGFQEPVTPGSFPAGLEGLHGSSPAMQSHSQTSKESPAMSPPSQIPGISTAWPGQSPQMNLPQETTPRYVSPHQRPLDGMPYPSPEDTTSSIGSLNAVNFNPASMSQPTSFLRQSLDLDDAERMRKRPRLRPPTSTDSLGDGGNGLQTDNAGENPGPLLSPEVPLLPRRNVLNPTNASTPGGDFFTTVMNDQMPSGSPAGDPVSASEKKWQSYLNSVEDNYGYDCGRPDLDLNRNDDHAAIDVNLAMDSTDKRKAGSVQSRKDLPNFDGSQYTYYEHPVPINIPRYLSPLPSSLLENPINLMYFHHYINHTSRMLVPHDCERNPFASVMPSSESPSSALRALLIKQWLSLIPTS